MSIKKQFVLEDEVCDFLERAVKTSSYSYSDLINNSLKIYLTLFFKVNGQATDLGHEIKRIALNGGKQWEDTVFSGFSGPPSDEDIEQVDTVPIPEEEVIKRACILFARLYQEKLVNDIEKKAEEKGRSAIGIICDIIKDNIESL